MAAYFPMFVDLRGKKVIIVGSHEKGRDKAEKLRVFGADIMFRDTPVSDVHEIIATSPSAVVVADTSLVDVQRLYEECVSAHIPINTVDVPETCSFIFPSMTVKKSLTVAVSTDGVCPSAGMWVKKTVEDVLPTETDDIIDWLAEIRRELKKRFSAETRRLIIRNLTAAAFESNRPLTTDETRFIIEKFV